MRHGRSGTVAALALALTCLLAATRPCQAARIKDVTTIQGVRANQLTGFGLVVGLAGTGAGADFTVEMARNMLRRMNVGRGLSELDGDNIAAVLVTAELPPFVRPGARIDVTVSALDEASSLRGGTLVLTPLQGADGHVYAVAQGALLVGGFSFRGEAAAVSKGHATVARIPGGATVEKTVPTNFLKKKWFTLCLDTADFATAHRIARAIEAGSDAHCVLVDAGTVRVKMAEAMMLNEQMAQIAEIQNLEITPDARAIVVINEKTGTVVAGHNVGIAGVAISHGSLTVITEERPEAAMPAPFTETEPVVLPRTAVTVVQERPLKDQPGLAVLKGGTTVNDVARALNALGAGPQDIISIFQAIKEAGALHAELRIM